MQFQLLSVCLLAAVATAQFPTNQNNFDSQLPIQPTPQDRAWGPNQPSQPLNPAPFNPQPNWPQERCSGGQWRNAEAEIPREYLQAHHRFSSDLLKHPGFWSNIHKNGLAATNSFTLGHFLAVLSQETFDLPTNNIPRLLRLPSKEKVVDSYSQQFHTYEEVTTSFFFKLMNF